MDIVDGYDEMSEKMIELAAQQPGILGVESVRRDDGLGITVSYWESEEAIMNWRRNMETSRCARARDLGDGTPSS